MKTSIIPKISGGLLALSVIHGASLSEISVHADEVKDRYTKVQPESTRKPMAEQYGFPNPGGFPFQARAQAALREIDLRVSLDLYEQILTELEAARLRLVVGPKKKGLSEQQIAEWREALQIKVSSLAQLCAEYRKNIELLSVEEAPPTTAAEVK